MNCFTRRQAESKWEYDHFIVAFFVALYSIFIFSGLAHLICAYTHNSCSNIGYLIPSWEMSVFALVTAHFLHSVHCWGGSYSIFFFSFSFMIIIIMEETSLSYDGIIFGKYTFSNEMGSRITPNLPLLVPMCWISLIYPTFLLTNVLIRGQPLVMPEPKNVFGSAILGSILLTAFDLVSEPIHTLYGHALWHHAAFVDSRTPLDTYQLLIDWKFEPNQAFQYYYDIPVQVYIYHFVIFLILMCCLFSELHGMASLRIRHFFLHLRNWCHATLLKYSTTENL